MTLKPWREIAVPHEDVLKGTFQQAEFAADLSRVHDGPATPEYQDPALFFQRTSLFMAASLLLIEPASASAHQQALDAAQHAAVAVAQAPSTGVMPISTGTGALPLHINDLTRVTQAAVGAAAPQPIKKQFHAAEDQERGV
ncbi:MAG: hypothetical protein WA134_14805 [Rhodoferax sp.]|uniref:hypothetical protein n=1 Tax=Rhodoferax sp. TaxID=50421 RepID=UPI003BB6694A|nr:hypothetical protein [Rhodoferax sp.]